MRASVRTLLLAALLAVGAPAAADPVVRDGGYAVHYAAMSTRDLSPEMAQRYGIRQAANRGLLLVNVQRERAPGTSVPVAAQAEGSAHTLLGEAQMLAFHTLPGGDAAGDLVAEFSFTPLETLRFDLQVRPQGAPRPLSVQFQQQFFGDD